jgi:hypothetical protein
MPASPDNLKRLSLKELDDVAWTYSSIDIRTRDRVPGDHTKCITCPKILHWKQLHTGHCVTRQCPPIKYHKLHNHAQYNTCTSTYRGMFKEGIGGLKAPGRGRRYAQDITSDELPAGRAGRIGGWLVADETPSPNVPAFMTGRTAIRHRAWTLPRVRETAKPSPNRLLPA